MYEQLISTEISSSLNLHEQIIITPMLTISQHQFKSQRNITSQKSIASQECNFVLVMGEVMDFYRLLTFV
jgi:hypothetical protein